MGKIRVTDKINVKKLNSLKTVFNGDMAYITQLKQQNQKGAITFAARRHNVNVLLYVIAPFWFLLF